MAATVSTFLEEMRSANKGVGMRMLLDASDTRFARGMSAGELVGNQVVTRSVFLLIALVLCTSSFGCGKREIRLPTHKVSGKVVQDGTGVPNATVVFHAKQVLEGFVKPRGITDANGAFTLTTYESDDGSPVGDYEVTVEQWLNDNPEAGATNRLDPKFSAPSTSGIKATVAAGENSLPAFELQ